MSREQMKERERNFFANLGDAGMAHSLSKPFSDPAAARLLAEIAACIALLPEPPATLVDLGCGTGWTSAFLAQCGYEVLGLDLSPDAVAAAKDKYQLPNLTFQVFDFDDPWNGPQDFAAALFFDSLHHASDETVALRTVRGMLREGGTLVVCEPGVGHAQAQTSIEAVANYGVRERDMPPKLVLAAARKAGFRGARTYPHPFVLHRHAYVARTRPLLRDRVLSTRLGYVGGFCYAALLSKRTWGIVVLTK